jgi:iron complex outermembrane receptor protein
MNAVDNQLQLGGDMKRNFLVGAAGSALTLLTATSVHAQTAQSSGQSVEPEVETIVVTATRQSLAPSAIPSTIQVISAEQTRVQAQIGGSSIDVVSALVPSFSPTRQKLSGRGEALRGRPPLMLIDGVPQSTPLRDGDRDGFTIDPFFLESIEVIYGSNAIQGVGAAGGVINFVTAKPAANYDGWTGAFLGQASGSGDFDSNGTSTKLAARLGRDFGVVDVIVGGAYETRGVFFDGAGRAIGVDSTQGELQDSVSFSGFLKAGVDFSDTRRLELMVNYFNLKGNHDYIVVAGDRISGRPATSIKGINLGEAATNNAWTVSATYTDGDLFGGTLTAQLFATDFESVFGGGIFPDFQDPRIQEAPTLFDQSSNNSDKHGFKLGWERKFEAVPGLRVTLGLDGLEDATFQELIKTGRKWVPDVKLTSTAPFAQANLALLDSRLNFAVGVRQETATIKVPTYDTLYFYGPARVEGGEPTFEQTLSNGGATFKLVDGFVVYASYAQGFTLPDVGRVLRAVSKPNQSVSTFLDVTPVVSDNIEVGVEVNAGPIQASLAHFWSTSKLGALLELKAGDVFEVQRQRTEISGFEGTLSARTPITGLKVSAAFASLLGKTDKNRDGVVDTDLDGLNISPDRVTLAADYQNGPWRARLSRNEFVARRFTGIGLDPRNNFDGYTLFDAYVRYETSFGSIALSAQNLTDENYLSYDSDTRLPTNNLQYFNGRGRVIGLAFERRF